MSDSATDATMASRTTKRTAQPSNVTPRDRDGLRWLGEQYGARLDVLGVLLGRLGKGEPLTHWTVRSIVDRWQKAGLVTKHRALNQMWVTPTRRGLDQVELDFPTWAVPVTRVRHCHYVNMVRLWYETTDAARSVPWTSERMTYLERGRQATWHIPDGVLRDTNPDTGEAVKHFAIEVELSHKSRRAYDEEVFGNLRSGINGVMFYVPSEAFARRLAGDIDSIRERRPTMPMTHINPLPEVPGASYDGSW